MAKLALTLQGSVTVVEFDYELTVTFLPFVYRQ